MKMTIGERKNTTKFGDLAVGACFTVEQGGLFIKADGRWSGDALVLVPIGPGSSYSQTGRVASFSSHHEVIPVEVEAVCTYK